MAYGIYSYKNQKLIYRYITLFLVFSTIFTLLQQITVLVLGLKNNLHIGNIWVVVQFVLLGFYYYYETKSSKFRRFQMIIAFMYLTYTFWQYVDVEKFYSFLSVTRYFSGVIFIGYSINVFHDYLRLPKENLLIDPKFWINSAVFIFFTGTIFVYLLIEYMTKHYLEFQGIVWSLHNILGIVRALLFGYAFILIRKETKVYLKIEKRHHL